MDIFSYLLSQKGSGGAGNIEEYIEQGRQAEWSEFWDEFQDNGNRTNYQHAFARDGWSDRIFKPKYNITALNPMQMFWYNTRITNLKQLLIDTGVTLSTTGATTLLQMFQSSSITHIPIIDARTASNINYTFGSGCKAVEIEKLIVSETTPFTSTTFNNASYLETLIIEGTIGVNGFNVQWSTKLSHESLMSIINALKDYSEDASGTTWTVTLGPDNIAKLTSDELKIAENKGWVVV